ncbi:copper-binding protein [Aquabacterium sp. A3]|uniref:copper-binding protein n=1 Tax=Aquabacterium sp. A3 TaxID=3132829 RepID=UPI00311947DC
MKISTLTRSLSALTLGLSLGLAAHAQSVDGEVRKVDAESGKITVRHGEIKNLDMPPMQMSFRVSDPAWLQSVQVGDKIRFTADKVNGQYTITTLEKK